LIGSVLQVRNTSFFHSLSLSFSLSLSISIYLSIYHIQVHIPKYFLWFVLKPLTLTKVGTLAQLNFHDTKSKSLKEFQL
jgi:hypothetical protein